MLHATLWIRDNRVFYNTVYIVRVDRIQSEIDSLSTFERGCQYTHPATSTSLHYQMLYRSAQTAPGGKTYTFEEAIMAGWAEDGGMLMPVDSPRVSRDTLRAWATLSYPQLVMAFLKMYVDADEVGDADLERIVSGAFAQFGDTEVVKMRGLDAAATMPWLDAASGPLHVLELWHGPTLAFKDLGMQVLVHFLKFFLARRQERITLLVGTSGDTGRYGRRDERDESVGRRGWVLCV